MCPQYAGYRPKRRKTTYRTIGNREGERSYGKSGSGVQAGIGGPGVHPNRAAGWRVGRWRGVQKCEGDLREPTKGARGSMYAYGRGLHARPEVCMRLSFGIPGRL